MCVCGGGGGEGGNMVILVFSGAIFGSPPFIIFDVLFPGPLVPYPTTTGKIYDAGYTRV